MSSIKELMKKFEKAMGDEDEDVVVDTITPSKAMLDAAKPMLEARKEAVEIAEKAKNDVLALMRKESSARRKFWVIVEEETGNDAHMRIVTNSKEDRLIKIEVLE
jgi:hypothetical protein